MWNEISCTKLQLPPETLTRGLLPPDPRSLCPLSSTEFVKLPPSPEQNSWVRHWSIRSYGKVGHMVRKVEIHRQIWTAQQNYWVEDEKGERTKMFAIYGHSQSIQQCVRAPLHSHLHDKYRYPRRRAGMQGVCTYVRPLSLRTYKTEIKICLRLAVTVIRSCLSRTINEICMFITFFSGYAPLKKCPPPEK